MSPPRYTVLSAEIALRDISICPTGYSGGRICEIIPARSRRYSVNGSWTGQVGDLSHWTGWFSIGTRLIRSPTSGSDTPPPSPGPPRRLSVSGFPFWANARTPAANAAVARFYEDDTCDFIVYLTSTSLTKSGTGGVTGKPCGGRVSFFFFASKLPFSNRTVGGTVVHLRPIPATWFSEAQRNKAITNTALG